MDEYITSKDLFMRFAPAFNFELDEDALLAEGIKRGFISEAGKESDETFYKINKDYKGQSP